MDRDLNYEYVSPDEPTESEGWRQMEIETSMQDVATGIKMKSEAIILVGRSAQLYELFPYKTNQTFAKLLATHQEIYQNIFNRN